MDDHMQASPSELPIYHSIEKETSCDRWSFYKYLHVFLARVCHSTERNVVWSLELLQVLACVPDPCLPLYRKKRRVIVGASKSTCMCSWPVSATLEKETSCDRWSFYKYLHVFLTRVCHSRERNVVWSLELLQVLACVPDPCLPL